MRSLRVGLCSRRRPIDDDVVVGAHLLEGSGVRGAATLGGEYLLNLLACLGERRLARLAAGEDSDRVQAEIRLERPRPLAGRERKHRVRQGLPEQHLDALARSFIEALRDGAAPADVGDRTP